MYNETEASDLGFFCLLKAYFIAHFVKEDNSLMMSGFPTGCNMPILIILQSVTNCNGLPSKWAFFFV